MEYKVLGIIFEITKKRYYFEVVDDEEYKRDDKVIVDTARGIEMGTVYLEPRMIDEADLVLPLKPVVRKATKEDIDRYTELREQAGEAFRICKKKDIRTQTSNEVDNFGIYF